MAMLPSVFNQIFRHGIDISRHHFKGVYMCTIGKNRKQASKPPEGVICTIHEGTDLLKVSDLDCSETTAKYGPITLSYQGLHATLRPWEPTACVIAAGIYNLLVHFPIKPGSRVFALDCSLRTLSHLADIVGESGRLIVVISDDHPEKPTQEELSQFPKMHPGVSVIKADIQNASLETYERLLSIPESSRVAFLMAMHPRLGMRSPARLLAGDPQKLVGRIFSFLECGDAAHVKCLVVGHCPEGMRVDAIREVVLSHIDILQQWRTPEQLDRNRGDSPGVNMMRAGDDLEDSDRRDFSDPREATESSDTKKRSSRHSGKDKEEGRSNKVLAPELTPQWVLLDLPTDCIVTPDNGDVTSGSITRKLNEEVVECMKKMRSGLRTGLLAKEQLPLKPYFNNHVLLLLKYVAHQDERRRITSKMKAPPGLALNSEDEDSPPSRRKEKPSTGRVPMPTFLSSSGGLNPPKNGSSSSAAASPAQFAMESAPPARPPAEQPGSSPPGSAGTSNQSGPPGIAVPWTSHGSWPQQGPGQRMPGSGRPQPDSRQSPHRTKSPGNPRNSGYGTPGAGGPVGGGGPGSGPGSDSGSMLARMPFGGKGYGMNEQQYYGGRDGPSSGQQVRFAPGTDETWAPKHPGPISSRSLGLGPPGGGGPVGAAGPGGISDVAPGAWGGLPNQGALRQPPPGLWDGGGGGGSGGSGGGSGGGGKGGYGGCDGGLGYDEVPPGHMGQGPQGHNSRWPRGPIRPMYNNMPFGQAPPMPQLGAGKGYSGSYMPGGQGSGAPQRASSGLLGPEHFQQIAEARAQAGGTSNDMQYMAFSL